MAVCSLSVCAITLIPEMLFTRIWVSENVAASSMPSLFKGSKYDETGVRQFSKHDTTAEIRKGTFYRFDFVKTGNFCVCSKKKNKNLKKKIKNSKGTCSTFI